MNQQAVDNLSPDLRAEFLNLLDMRFWKRTTEYQYKEKLALSTGLVEQNITISQFPPDVLAKFSEASSAILAEESAKLTTRFPEPFAGDCKRFRRERPVFTSTKMTGRTFADV